MRQPPRILLLPLVLLCILSAVALKILSTKMAGVESERHAYTRMVLVDRSGTIFEASDLQGRYVLPRFSPEGRDVLLTRISLAKADIWRFSVAGQTVRELTNARYRSTFPVWSPDGRDFGFAYGASVLRTTGAAKANKIAFRDDEWDYPAKFPTDWSSDGRWIAFTAKGGIHAYSVALVRAGTGEVFELLQRKSEIEFYDARFSEDGKWVALTSDLSGRHEVYVAPLPPDASGLPLSVRDLIRITQEGGDSPRWGPGLELYFMNSRGDVMVSDVKDRRGPVAARKLFRILEVGRPGYRYRYGGFDVARGGETFVIVLSRDRDG
jgi:Tol biopolymer transport system component